MGKCSGLKGGGHHRRALDVAAKKQSEKAARKKEQAEAGKRALILKEILTKIDKDCDLYLDAAVCEQFQPSHNGNAAAAAAAPAAAAAANPELCRKHFRHEACTNKRCRFSKEYSIAEALSNVMSGTNTNTAFDNFNNKSNNKNNNGHNNDDGDNDNVKNTMTIPALRYLPGILGDHHGGSKAKKNRRILRRRRPDDDAVGDHLHPQTPPPPPPLLFSLFETALSEGSSAVDRIVSCLDEDRDVVSFGSTCWHLYDQILRDQGCPGVQLRRYRSNHRKLDRRNKTLLSNKALGGSLRYAVGYFESTTFHNNNKQKSKKKNNNSSSSSSNNNKPRLRPVLIFDYENPNVYKAFVESGVRKTYRHLGAGGDGGDAGLELESALDKNCKLSG